MSVIESGLHGGLAIGLREPTDYVLARDADIPCGRCLGSRRAAMYGVAAERNGDEEDIMGIAADLVERGYLARAVSQEDGRRSVLVPTDAAWGLLDAFLKAKWQRTMKLFAAWPEADIVTFARLFGRYSAGMREQYPGRG